MRRAIKLSIIQLCFLLSMLGLPSCDKNLEVGSFTEDPKLGEVFDTEKEANKMIRTIYLAISMWSTELSFTSACSSDELSVAINDQEYHDFERNALRADNKKITQLWKDLFFAVMQTNTCLEGLQQTRTLPEMIKNQLIAEVRALRAFEYFYLVNLWGEVPLLISSDWKVNGFMPKAQISKVYDQILSDLTEASLSLSAYPPSKDKLRLNRFGIAALLARVYLYMRDWKNAEIQATIVINSGDYTPLPALNNAFLKNSRETIWQIGSVNQMGATEEASVFLTKRHGFVTQTLLDDFEDKDLRKDNWLKELSPGVETFKVPYKYKDPGFFGNINVNEYQVILRLSEQYLIRAEARAMLNKNEAAISDINLIRRRSRAVISDLPLTLNQAQCLSAIEKERRLEFFSEWGHRWFDLKRTGRAEAVLGKLKPNLNSNSLRYPIPANDLLLNPNLDQNPGY